MKFIKISQNFRSAFVLVVLVLMWGCGGGGGSTSNEVKVASISVTPSSNSEYVIQGNNLVGVAGIELTVSYDSTKLSSPTVTRGGLFPDALFQDNPQLTPSSIKIAIVSATDMSGTGQLAKISFATATGPGAVSIVSANTINSKLEQVPITF